VSKKGKKQLGIVKIKGQERILTIVSISRIVKEGEMFVEGAL
jgi:hypothetical protein